MCCARELHNGRVCSYAPSGIGTARINTGFRDRHQISFLHGLSDRMYDSHAGHLFADSNYISFTVCPSIHMTISGSGWLGIATGNQKISMHSLDF